MRCVLNEKKISSIKVTCKRQEFWDVSLPGFGMRVTKSGHKTFFVMCRDQGKQRRISLGRIPLITLAEAREAARDKLRRLSQGLPLEEVRREKIKVKEVFNSFVEIYAKKKNRDWRGTETRLQNSLIKEYGELDIREVTRENIIALLDKIVARNAPIQANRVLAGTSKFFKWCAERGYIESSPVLYITKPSKENRRERVLTDEELHRIWLVAGKMPYPFGPLLQILILTGQRKGEVAGMRWSELDLKKRVWVIPRERVKNDNTHSVPLSDQVIRILKELPRFLHSDLVFTTTGKTPVSGFGKIKAKLDDASMVKNWIIHDIRRTAASGMAQLSVSPHVIEKVLNHISGTFSSVTGVYNRYGYDAEKRNALCLWGRHVEEIQFSLDHKIELN